MVGPFGQPVWSKRMIELITECMQQVPEADWPFITGKRDAACHVNYSRLSELRSRLFSYKSVEWKPSHSRTAGEFRLAATSNASDTNWYERVQSDRMQGHIFSSATALDQLDIKVGAQVVSTKPISYAGCGKQIPNGTFGKVVGMQSHSIALMGLAVPPSEEELSWWKTMMVEPSEEDLVWPVVEFKVRAGAEVETVVVTVTPIMFEVMDCQSGSRLAGKLGLPLQCSWAMTCHRAQGLTLPGVVINLGNPFAYGQVYTAVSRVRKFSDISFVGSFSDRWILASPVVMSFLNVCEEKWLKFDNSEEIIIDPSL